MTSDITLSKAVRNNLLSLQRTSDLLTKTQERLSTGLKVNSALDNPTNFFTASSLNSRAGDLGRLLDAVGNATQTLEAADNGISAITKLVEAAQASARQSLQAKGQVTESTVEGTSSATFNPQALASVTGTGAAITADAAATLDTGSIAGDTDITFSTGDLDGVGTGTGQIDAATGAADGDQITINVDGTDFTVDFDASSSPSIASNTLTIGIDESIDTLATNLNTLLGADVTVTENDGNLTFTAASTVDSITLSDDPAGVGGPDGTVLTKFGLNGVGADFTASATAGDRIATRNSTLQALTAGGAATLQVDFGGTTVGTVDFSNGNVTNKEDLIAAIDGFANVSASGTAGSAGAVTIETTDNLDADTNITLTADANGTLSALGVTPDTVSGTVTTVEPNNLLTQGAVSDGDVVSIAIGDSTPFQATFGTGAGQISTLAELNSSLGNLAGGSATVDTNGNLSVTADTADDTITLGGDAAALTALGTSAGEASTLIDGTNIIAGDTLSIQVGSNTALSVTFGTGVNQVNTFSELQDELGRLAGGTATIDNQTGAISIEASQGSDNITIGATAPGANDPEDVAGSFGLPIGVSPSTTTDSAVRDDLQGQYNELLLQIDELAEDSGFNGVNLLDGDDLKVIFNEDGSSKLDIEGRTFDSQGLGLSRVSSDFFQSDANIENTLDSLDGAIETLRSQASKFGSNLSIVETREDFTKEMINTLETGAANLTLADSNEEGANLLALQTRQSLSSTALSLASQADQNVLRLL